VRDAFTLGMRAEADVQCVFVAESDTDKLAVLRATSSPMYKYTDARSASHGCPHVHCLSATPSCRRASRANHVSDPAAADAALVSDFEIVADAARRAQPLVLLLEQSDGLRTHHPSAYGAMCRVLDALPYVWAHRSMDLHDDLGGCHLRCRLLWVGVLIDVFVK
jgi:site-specific DNA-cytosine methylase